LVDIGRSRRRGVIGRLRGALPFASRGDSRGGSRTAGPGASQREPSAALGAGDARRRIDAARTRLKATIPPRED
jgi:hypothetical protein